MGMPIAHQHHWTVEDVWALPEKSGERYEVVDGVNPLTRPLPLLAVEVLSPSTARYDRIVKRPRYQRTGVECWIADLDSRLVERWTPDATRPEICASVIEWQPIGASAPLVVDLVALFQEIVGDVA